MCSLHCTQQRRMRCQCGARSHPTAPDHIPHAHSSQSRSPAAALHWSSTELWACTDIRTDLLCLHHHRGLCVPSRAAHSQVKATVQCPAGVCLCAPACLFCGGAVGSGWSPPPSCTHSIHTHMHTAQHAGIKVLVDMHTCGVTRLHVDSVDVCALSSGGMGVHVRGWD